MIKCSKCGILCAENRNEETMSETEGIVGIVKKNGEILCIDCLAEEWGELVEISPMVSPDLLKYIEEGKNGRKKLEKFANT